HGLGAVAGRADDLDRVDERDEHAQPLAHHALIVGDQDPDPARRSNAHPGTSNSTSHPSVVGPARAVPPARAARSRIAVSPCPPPRAGPRPRPGAGARPRHPPPHRPQPSRHPSPLPPHPPQPPRHPPSRPPAPRPPRPPFPPSRHLSPRPRPPPSPPPPLHPA